MLGNELITQKILKKWGHSLVIKFTKEDIQILNASEGDKLSIHVQLISKKEDREKTMDKEMQGAKLKPGEEFDEDDEEKDDGDDGADLE